MGLTQIDQALQLVAQPGRFGHQPAEHHRVQGDRLQRPVGRGAHRRPARPAAQQRHLAEVLPRPQLIDQQLAAVGVQHRGTHDRSVGTDADQRVRGRAAKAVERGQVGECLGEVRLALAVEAHHRGDAVVELERGRDIVAEVDQLEPGDDHSRSPTASARQNASA